mmetsp:Transcript_52176/g.121770  ORF Transcript_52176/g.121770 Transcript_52176/m.121770 type:complete len:99 (+) Transcript_52176:581-877(+)
MLLAGVASPPPGCGFAVTLGGPGEGRPVGITEDSSTTPRRAEADLVLLRGGGGHPEFPEAADPLAAAEEGADTTGAADSCRGPNGKTELIESREDTLL